MANRLRAHVGKEQVLVEYLQKIISTGGDELEIEYRDGKEWFTAFNGSFGFGIGSLDSGKAKPIFREFEELKKTERIAIDSKDYVLRFRQFESFGETVYRIQMKEIKSNKRRVV